MTGTNGTVTGTNGTVGMQFRLEELARLGDAAASKGRVILAHLGNGASLAAVRDGKSIDTREVDSPYKRIHIELTCQAAVGEMLQGQALSTVRHALGQAASLAKCNACPVMFILFFISDQRL